MLIKIFVLEATEKQIQLGVIFTDFVKALMVEYIGLYLILYS